MEKTSLFSAPCVPEIQGDTEKMSYLDKSCSGLDRFSGSAEDLIDCCVPQIERRERQVSALEGQDLHGVLTSSGICSEQFSCHLSSHLSGRVCEILCKVPSAFA